MKALVFIALAGCGGDLLEGWELDHDRIIAVRATPPHILPGEQTTIDLLLGFENDPVVERSPDRATVVSPQSMAPAVVQDADRWVVTSPNLDALAAARDELQLAADAPVPLQIAVEARWPYPITSVDGTTFHATKTVWLGDSAANPEIPELQIDDADAPEGAELVVAKDTRVPLVVAADSTHIVNWLSSCGEVHDFDLPSAYLVVPPESKQDGELVLVLRDDRGGVTWRVWPIRAE